MYKLKKLQIYLTGLLTGIFLVLAAYYGYRFVTKYFYFPFMGEMSVENKINAITEILDAHYINDFEKEQLLKNAYAGFVAGLGDPYSAYMDAKALSDLHVRTEGTYAGIGVVVSVDKSDNRIVVLVPYKGSPGANAGILPGDKIIRVNETPVTGDMLDEAVSMMKGEPGTGVNVTLYRESDKTTFEKDIVRAVITIPSIYGEMLDGSIGYIEISGFDYATTDQFIEEYYKLLIQGMKGLIIDVRDNPGGLLDVVVRITDILVAGDYIVYTEDKNGERHYYYADAERINVPLVVLINERSASASEILAGAVKDSKTGILVGKTTFGKGLVQSVFNLPDKTGVKTTIAKYFTPSGVCIDKEGIAPDYEIDLPEEYAGRMEVPPEFDTQLQKAIEIIIREASYAK